MLHHGFLVMILLIIFLIIIQMVQLVLLFLIIGMDQIGCQIQDLFILMMRMVEIF